MSALVQLRWASDSLQILAWYRHRSHWHVRSYTVQVNRSVILNVGDVISCQTNAVRDVIVIPLWLSGKLFVSSKLTFFIYRLIRTLHQSWRRRG